MSKIEDRILVITDLLLGAAYADDKLAGKEEAAVRKLLGELLSGAQLPAEVDARIKTFPAGSFDMLATAKDFAADPPIAKRKLLELVSAVSDADGEVDLEEDEYLVALAKALGMKPDEYKDLTLDVQVEDLKKALGELRKAPPPK
jgi:uncharacterized tellurite resistance protein B-like protein